MNDDFQTRIPEFDAVAALQQRLASKKTSSQSSTIPNGPFDPHQLMVRKKEENNGQIPTKYSVQKWSESDIKKLEDFCRQHGIIGFNCGTMSPLAALAFLKNKLGIIDEIPRNEGYGPNYPYTEAMKKKILLNG